MTAASAVATLRRITTTLPRVRVSVLRDYGIVVSFIALFVTLSIASPVFFTRVNLLNVVDQSAAVGLIACGGTLVIIAGGFDLSVGAIYAISGVVAAEAVPHVGVWPAIALGALAGAGFGLCNGLLTTVGRINPIITTLATALMIRGLAVAITGGFLVRVDDPDYAILGTNQLGGVRYTTYLFVVFAIAAAVLLSRTTLGRAIYASGGNAEAARLSGIRVGVVRASTFVISGLSAGLAGVMISSRVSTGQADTGIGIELTAIAAVVIGGTSILGGEGAIWRSVLGVLLLTLIGNGFNLLNVNPTYQQIFQGAIILGAVAIDAWSRRTS
jgi:ribose transport system permease protein